MSRETEPDTLCREDFTYIHFPLTPKRVRNVNEGKFPEKIIQMYPITYKNPPLSIITRSPNNLTPTDSNQQPIPSPHYLEEILLNNKLLIVVKIKIQPIMNKTLQNHYPQEQRQTLLT